jgi:hypothetical protein
LRQFAVARAPQPGAHARDQLARREGLDDVVVGADLQAHDAVHFFRARGQHHDGDLRHRADFAADGEAVFARHHHVEQHKVEAAGCGVAHRAGGTGQHRHFETGFGQELFGQAADLGIVVDQQNMAFGRGHHGRNVGTKRARCQAARGNEA